MSTDKTYGDLVREALLWGEADWLYPGAILLTIAPISGAPDADHPTVALGVLAAVLLDDLMVAGDVDGEFRPWVEPPPVCLARMSESFWAPPAELYPGAGGWLQITERGRTLLAELPE